MSALPAGTCFPSNPEIKASRDPLKKGRLDFAAVNAAALRELPTLLARWLPDGRVNGREYEARNPTAIAYGLVMNQAYIASGCDLRMAFGGMG